MKSVGPVLMVVMLAGCQGAAPEQESLQLDSTRAAILPETAAVAARNAAPVIDPDSILGAWAADGENFSWVIARDSILFEIDMKQHPYVLVSDTLIIDRQDPTIGIQKTRILRLTADTMVIQDVTGGATEALIRLR